MKIVIFGLTVSSSWGNGHATLWRSLCGALGRLGHHVTFFERDAPYYAASRDITDLSPTPCGFTRRGVGARRGPEGPRQRRRRARDLVLPGRPRRGRAHPRLQRWSPCLYDLDTPVTLARRRAGRPVDYLGPEGLSRFDLALSFTGGPALGELTSLLGARKAVALHGSVDPAVHRPAPPLALFRADLSYLGTYSADRQAALFALFLEPTRRSPERRFLLGGSLYPHDFPWLRNLHHVGHVAPQNHAAFYGSSSLTLNITRGPMAEMGYCPSGRLFRSGGGGRRRRQRRLGGALALLHARQRDPPRPHHRRRPRRAGAPDRRARRDRPRRAGPRSPRAHRRSPRRRARRHPLQPRRARG